MAGIGAQERAHEQVGVIINPNRLIDIVEENHVNDRILIVKMKLTSEEMWSLIVVYGLDKDANKEMKNEYFCRLQEVV